MKIIELFESLSKTVYHYTKPEYAYEILRTGEFKLTASLGSDFERTLQPTGYPYYLSTTRTKYGGYHESAYLGSTAVMFVLDGDFYNANYKSAPVDYWNDRSPSAMRPHEAEDRIFSKTPTISADGITAVHLYAAIPEENEVSNYHRPSYKFVRKIIILAKQRGIECYLYTDYEAWLHQDVRKSVNPSTVPMLQDVAPLDRRRRHTSEKLDYFTAWLQLLQAKKSSELSPRAEKLLYNIKYYGDNANVLNADLSNSRFGRSTGYDQANKIVMFMSKHNMDTKQFVEYIKNRWKKIEEAEKYSKTVDSDSNS